MTEPDRRPGRGSSRVAARAAADAAGGAAALALIGLADLLLRPAGAPSLASPALDLSLLGVAGGALGLALGILRATRFTSFLHPFGILLGAGAGFRAWLLFATGGAGLLGERASAEALRGAMFLLGGAILGQLFGMLLRRTPGTRAIQPRLARDVAFVLLVAVPWLLSQFPRTVPAAPRPNVLLITVDTLRSDRLGFTGHDRPTSPHLDRLSRRATTHFRAVTPQPRTLPGLASLLTGAAPAGHGVRDNFHYALGEDATTLAELLQSAGWATASVNSSPVLAHDSGIHQGFASASDRGDDWSRLPLVRGVAHIATLVRMRRGDRELVVTGLALDWLTRRPRDRPFFLWVHYLAPHMPYEPAAPFDTRFDPEYEGEYRAAIDYGPISKGDMTYRNPLSPRTMEHVRALYDGEVATSDRAIGRLLRAMELRGDLDRTIVLVSADHGESLDEHGYFMNHGDFVYGPATNIPLVWAEPDRPAALAVEVPSLSDVFALALRLVEVDKPTGVEGRWPAADFAFGESDFCRFPDLNDRLGYLLPPEIAQDPGNISGWKERWEAQAIRSKQRFAEHGGFKLVLTPRPDGDRVELFDVRVDPGETRDVAADEPARVAVLLGAVVDWMRVGEGRVGTARDRILDESLREQLDGLGYLGR